MKCFANDLEKSSLKLETVNASDISSTSLRAQKISVSLRDDRLSANKNRVELARPSTSDQWPRYYDEIEVLLVYSLFIIRFILIYSILYLPFFSKFFL